MSTCGRCRGRREHRNTTGVGMVPCEECGATGVKQRKAMKARSGSVPLPEGARCIVCGEFAIHNHHVVKRQRTDWLVTPKAAAEKCKADPRGVTPLCDSCHNLAEKEELHLEREHLHPQFPAFVGEWDLWAGLPRYMACGAAAPTTTSPGERPVVSRDAQSSREVQR